MNWKKTLIVSLLILAAGGAVTVLIFSTVPTAKRSGASKETAMLVDVIRSEKGNYRPTIEVMGTVEPSQEITLSPRVSGQIIDRSDDFTPGGQVNDGETLLQIDPADFKNTLQQRRSELRQARANLNIEMGRQQVAKQEFKLIGDTLEGMNKGLVLREPQLQSARSDVESAEAAVNQAQLDLERTTIKAPFDAHILSRNANVGSHVTPGENLGRLVGMDNYWVEATVPLSKLRWLSIPDGDVEDAPDEGSKVRIRNRTAWEQDEYRTGYLYKQVGTLEEDTRMARILITVPDPLAYEDTNSDKPAMMIGAFVEARIQARELDGVVRLNRDYIRKGENVWVMKDGKLEIRDVNIAFRDAKYAYITNGLDNQEQVVTTNLTTVTEGAELRLSSSDTTGTAANTTRNSTR